MVDYIIAIACNTFPEVEKHDEGQMEEYIKNTSVQKLTYKLEDRKGWETDGTICGYLMHRRE